MSRTRSAILVLAAAMLLVAGLTARADLPNPEPPQPSPERPKGLSLRRTDPPAANQWTNDGFVRRMAENYEETNRLELDLLMKRIADPRLSMPSQWEQQVSHVSRVGHMDIESIGARVDELLLLLDDTSPLPATGSDRSYQVRDRAAVALSVIAHLWFGGFPACGPDETLTDEQQQQARLVTEQWRSWWRQAESLDYEQRRKLAAELRKPLLESEDEDLLWPNLVHAQNDSDLAALPALARMLTDMDPMDDRAQRAVSVYGNLCRNSEAPKDAGLVLVEFMRKNNEPGVINRCNALRQATFYAQQLSGVSKNYMKQIEPEEGQEATGGTTTYIIDPEALDAWEKGIKDKAADAGKKDNDAEDDDEAEFVDD